MTAQHAVLHLTMPHASQLSVLHERKRFNALCCGRRWGKTTIAVDRLVRCALRGQRAAWFNPTYRSLSDAWRELQRVLNPITARSNESEHRLELHGGGLVECWSLDNPDAGRGRAYHSIVVDEAAMVRDLEQAWEQSIRPMLTDYSGSAWFLSTPKGTANYFHMLYQRGQDPQNEEWASWQRPTATNPYIKPSEIEAMRQDLTDLAFAQECLAQFVLWAGAVFRRIMDAVKPILLEPAAVIGVDWGRTNDSTVFTAVSHRGAVVGIDRFRGMEYALQRGRLAEFWKRHGGRAWIMAEINSMGGPVVEQLQRDGLPVVPFQTTNVSKSAIIEGLTLAFERGDIAIPNDPTLIGELQAFEGKPLPSGMTRYSAPAGQHDDMVMSLAFAWAGLTAPRHEVRRTGGDYQISPI